MKYTKIDKIPNSDRILQPLAGRIRKGPKIPHLKLPVDRDPNSTMDGERPREEPREGP
jgi:hypothetical protein